MTGPKFATETVDLTASSTSKVTPEQLVALDFFLSYLNRLHAEFKLGPMRYSTDDLNSYIDRLVDKSLIQ